MIRDFALHGITPPSRRDFALVLLFYVSDLHHRHFKPHHFINQHLIFSKEEKNEVRSNLDSRLQKYKHTESGVEPENYI